MNEPSQPSAIPAEALARQARLRAALRFVEAAGPSREPAPILDLRAGLAGGSRLDPVTWMAAIAAADLAEEANEFLRAFRRETVDRELAETLARSLAPLVEKAQQRRTAFWQLDTRRTLIRFSYAKAEGALGFDDGDLHAIFLHAFRFEGLGLALDLGKRPRPLLTAGLPLAANVGGVAETMDGVLKRGPGDEPPLVMARLNHRLPAGLHIHHWESLPDYATPVADLARLSHWRWEVSPGQRHHVEAGISAFLAREVWPWDRAGLKAGVPLDLRCFVSGVHWEGDTLCFATGMGAFHAINPLKVLGAILGSDPSRITGLHRTAVELKPDTRLAQAERFEPKLKNMYEDAVLLSGGSNITLVDEDDDEPIHLGPDSGTT